MYQRQRQTLDGSPIEDLYRRHAHDVLRYISRYIFTKEDADDLLVEVFLAVIENENWRRLQKEEEQLAWLQRVAHNKVVDYQRRVVKRSMVTLDEMLDSSSVTDHLTPEKAVMDREERDLLMARLAELPALQQQVLWLRFEEGLRTKEIALKLHRSDGAIRSLLLRSLNLLRNLYQLQGGAD
jgi:RNA polymerase sigma-70 factor (ECF subfamily)